jgi:hypothetical protein
MMSPFSVSRVSSSSLLKRSVRGASPFDQAMPSVCRKSTRAWTFYGLGVSWIL